VSFARYALCAIAVILIGAEVVRPTTFHAKRVSHVSLLGLGPPPALDQAELDDLPPIVTPALGNIDAVIVVADGRERALAPDGALPRTAALRLVGWCADPVTRAAGSSLLAIVDGKRRIDLSSGYRLPREDAARILNAPALRASGFAVELPAAELGPGPHAIRVAVVTSDGRAISIFPTVVRVTSATR
jgi:hypothetical protein